MPHISSEMELSLTNNQLKMESSNRGLPCSLAVMYAHSDLLGYKYPQCREGSSLSGIHDINVCSLKLKALYFKTLFVGFQF